jgi:hypothetical protein
VSRLRGAKRSERSEDGTPEARDPPEGVEGEGAREEHKPSLERKKRTPQESA